MAYSSGNTILAADFNTFRTSVEDIFGDTNSGSVAPGALIFGYGETMLQAAVSAGTGITAAQWNNLYMMIHRCAGHQGSTISIGGSVTADAYSAGGSIGVDGNLAADIATVVANKGNVDASNLTTTARNDKSGTANWSASTVHSFTQTFASYDAARHFYNQGGAMIISASRTGGSGHTQNSNWTALLTAVGTVTMTVASTAQSGSGGTAGKSFDDIVAAVSTTHVIFNQADSGAYASNNYKIECSCNAAKTVYTWTITFTDGHANAFEDYVDGTLASNVSEKRATGTYVNSDAPSYSAGSYTQS